MGVYVMHILAVSINYRTAPLAIREKLAFSEADHAEAMKTLNAQKSIMENVILSTCNRTELYVVADQIHTGRYYIKDFLEKWFNIEKQEFSPHLIVYEADGAIEHLMRVSAGLDSMVLGETQILGQVKQAFQLSQGSGTTGTVFNQLFKQAVTVAKKGHKETAIGENAASVSYAAVELSKKVFGELKDKHIAIIGAGKMGELAAKNLFGFGVGKVTVLNRTLQKAEAVASQFSGEATTLEDRERILEEADIVISSTGSDEYVITKDMVARAHRKRKGNPLFFVDIAVPRDLDPGIADLEGMFLYDIDDLQGIVDENLSERKKAAEEIELMIEAEIVEFNEWLRTLGVVPVISALRQKALGIQAETMESIERKLPELSARERKVLNKHTKSIVNQILKEPITQAKELANEPGAEESLQLLTQIFGIEEEVQEQVKIQEQKNNHAVKVDDKGILTFPALQNMTQA